MNLVLARFRSNPLDILLIFFPLPLMAKFLGWGDIWVFAFSAVGMIPMAGYIGEATESLAVYTGPRIGGLLNATLGNAAELIITLVAIRAGLLDLVKASITGSILGNVLLVLGFAILFGGARHGVQKFDRRHTGNQAVLLMLAVAALAIPSFFSHSIGADTSTKVEVLSLGVAGVMIVLYAIGILYSFKAVAGGPVSVAPTEENPDLPKWSLGMVIGVLAAATIGVVILSEILVGAVEPVLKSLGWSEFFLGIILIPVVGNVAEHLVAVQMALRNKMELSVEIALSSSLQIALFVAPLLVFISLIMGNPLTLIFNPFELMALGAGVLITTFVAFDGESNWLEGSALVAVYLILGLAFFLLPTAALME